VYVELVTTALVSQGMARFRLCPDQHSPILGLTPQPVGWPEHSQWWSQELDIYRGQPKKKNILLKINTPKNLLHIVIKNKESPSKKQRIYYILIFSLLLYALSTLKHANYFPMTHITEV